MKLNLGCGAHVIPDWVNVDYSLGSRLMKTPFFRSLNKRMKLFNLNWDKNIYIYDLTREFPWPGSSIDIIYSSHTLEHFSKEDGRRFLSECRRVLRKDGIIRIIVPDLKKVVTEYTEGRIYADDFVEKLGVLYGSTNNSMKKRFSIFFEYPHKCMYDTPRLLEILKEIGFEVTARNAFDSDIDEIRVIELEGRTENAAIVEGRKR
jgi:ubiquinone/menaquinone biosynthesis C-methylase UbiE